VPDIHATVVKFSRLSHQASRNRIASSGAAAHCSTAPGPSGSISAATPITTQRWLADFEKIEIRDDVRRLILKIADLLATNATSTTTSIVPLIRSGR
jgi:hypothetical protein